MIISRLCSTGCQHPLRYRLFSRAPLGSVVPGLVISGWVLNITLNVLVTLAIVGRLRQMGRSTASLTSTCTNQYALSIYVVVESGAIFAGVHIVSLVLYASHNTALSVGLNITSQVAVCVHCHSFPPVH